MKPSNASWAAFLCAFSKKISFFMVRNFMFKALGLIFTDREHMSKDREHMSKDREYMFTGRKYKNICRDERYFFCFVSMQNEKENV